MPMETRHDLEHTTERLTEGLRCPWKWGQYLLCVSLSQFSHPSQIPVGLSVPNLSTSGRPARLSPGLSGVAVPPVCAPGCLVSPSHPSEPRAVWCRRPARLSPGLSGVAVPPVCAPGCLVSSAEVRLRPGLSGVAVPPVCAPGCLVSSSAEVVADSWIL